MNVCLHQWQLQHNHRWLVRQVVVVVQMSATVRHPYHRQQLQQFKNKQLYVLLFFHRFSPTGILNTKLMFGWSILFFLLFWNDHSIKCMIFIRCVCFFFGRGRIFWRKKIYFLIDFNSEKPRIFSVFFPFYRSWKLIKWSHNSDHGLSLFAIS